MKLTTRLGKRSYDIVIKRGCLANFGRLAHLNRKVLLVTDSGVPPQYAEQLAAQCPYGQTEVVFQGEASKNIDTWRLLLQRMAELRFERGDAVVAVGGGVVGDLAGFVAASYMRGIGFFQVPTTILAQVDSSIGGKVALDLGGAKNLVGAFHQPELVLVDPNTLKTLSRRHYYNGLVEALKMGLTGVPELVDLFEQGDFDKNIERIIYLSLQYKKDVVERDETEQGERRILNFGHTIGHAVEAAGASRGLLHGEAVAIGMLPMITDADLRARVAAILQRMDIDTEQKFPKERLLHYMASDKKRSGAGYNIVRVGTVGEGVLETVSAAEMEALLDEVAE